MPAEEFSELTALTTIRLGYLLFNFFAILYINCVMLQMAQIVLFIASEALDKPTYYCK